MLQLSQFVWTLRSLVQVFLNNFLLKDQQIEVAIKSDYSSPYTHTPFSFFANTPFNDEIWILKGL